MSEGIVIISIVGINLINIGNFLYCLRTDNKEGIFANAGSLILGNMLAWYLMLR